jgi:hypothetical protein
MDSKNMLTEYSDDEVPDFSYEEDYRANDRDHTTNWYFI